jgi:hypothetical protein
MYLKYFKISIYVLLKFSYNRLKKIIFSSRLKKNHFISRKLFQKRPNKADLAFLKPNGYPEESGVYSQG